jgi:hypothetical protein
LAVWEGDGRSAGGVAGLEVVGTGLGGGFGCRGVYFWGAGALYENPPRRREVSLALERTTLVLDSI